MSVDLTSALVDSLSAEDLERLAGKLAPFMRPAPVVKGGWLDSRAAADYLGIPHSTLRKLTADRAIPFEQSAPGCKCYFRTDELDDWRVKGEPVSLR